MKKILVLPLLIGVTAGACAGAFMYPSLLTVWGVLISAFTVLLTSVRFNRLGLNEPIDLFAVDFVFQIFWWGFITHQVAASSHGWAMVGWSALGMVGCSAGYLIYFFLGRAIYRLWKWVVVRGTL